MSVCTGQWTTIHEYYELLELHGTLAGHQEGIRNIASSLTKLTTNTSVLYIL